VAVLKSSRAAKNALRRRRFQPELQRRPVRISDGWPGVKTRWACTQWALWHNAFALVAAGLWPLSIPIYAYMADSRERTWKPVYWG
jgi:hypothetical protein